MLCLYYIFFFNDTATTEIYTLSLHDALPISHKPGGLSPRLNQRWQTRPFWPNLASSMHHSVRRDRKSTRLNSSHANISYAVFCLKKKKTNSLCPSSSHPCRSHTRSPNSSTCP